MGVGSHVDIGDGTPRPHAFLTASDTSPPLCGRCTTHDVPPRTSAQNALYCVGVLTRLDGRVGVAITPGRHTCDGQAGALTWQTPVRRGAILSSDAALHYANIFDQLWKEEGGMGSLASGHFRTDRKTTIEACLRLDLRQLIWFGATQPGARRRGIIHWPANAQRDAAATIEYGGPVAYGQKTAVRLLFVYRWSGRSLRRDRAVSTSK